MRTPLPLHLHLHLPLVLLAACNAIIAAHEGDTFQLQQYDSLRVARCVAQCWDEEKDKKHACEDGCLRSQYTKPGTCPSSSELSVFDVACITACNGDSECSGTLKCCTHSCGVTCQQAQGLDGLPGLPPVPVNVTPSERRHGRAVQLDWVLPEGASGSPETSDTLLFVVEERHHVGRHLTPERFGSWVTRHRSIRTTATLKNMLRPGRWYEFRVAAVNSNGSRGFSEPSAPFRLSLAPKAPGPPQSLTMGSLSVINGTLRGVLSWRPPVSDLPVQRYKVFWSRRLQSSSTSQVSVLVHHQTVPGEMLQIVLKALEPNSLYFLQVQAMAQFGRERLKSEKAAIFLNTGNHNKAVPASDNLEDASICSDDNEDDNICDISTLTTGWPFIRFVVGLTKCLFVRTVSAAVLHLPSTYKWMCLREIDLKCYELVVETPSTTENSNHRSVRGALDIWVQRVFWSRNQLIARLRWRPMRSSGSYSVTWTSTQCQTSLPETHTTVTHGTHFDIRGLKFECQYQVTVRQTVTSSHTGSTKASIEFTTPTCENLPSYSPNDKPLCSLDDPRNQLK